MPRAQLSALGRQADEETQSMTGLHRWDDADPRPLVGIMAAVIGVMPPLARCMGHFNVSMFGTAAETAHSFSPISGLIHIRLGMIYRRGGDVFLNLWWQNSLRQTQDHFSTNPQKKTRAQRP